MTKPEFDLLRTLTVIFYLKKVLQIKSKEEFLTICNFTDEHLLMAGLT